MRVFIEALKRLYQDRRVTKEKIVGLREQKTITSDECDYILAEEN